MPKRKDLENLKTVNEMTAEEVKEISFQEGDIIGNRYEIQSLIGAGGMGAVYLVKDKRLSNHQKALKMMMGKLFLQEKTRQRFCNEILISQMLNHPNILRVFDYGEHGSLMYYTMEYVDGSDMREWINDTKGQAPWEEILQITTQILDGLEAAHEQTVHRDIKPENILLVKKGPVWVVKICDFGLAQIKTQDTRLSLSMGSMGTYGYMAPEQMNDASKVDKRADLYSVGAIVYEALTGKTTTGLFKPPSRWRKEMDATIDLVLEKALEPEPEERYQSAQEMKEALQSMPYKKSKPQPAKAAVKPPPVKPVAIHAPAAKPAPVFFPDNTVNMGENIVSKIFHAIKWNCLALVCLIFAIIPFVFIFEQVDRYYSNNDWYELKNLKIYVSFSFLPLFLGSGLAYYRRAKLHELEIAFYWIACYLSLSGILMAASPGSIITSCLPALIHGIYLVFHHRANLRFIAVAIYWIGFTGVIMGMVLSLSFWSNSFYRSTDYTAIPFIISIFSSIIVSIIYGIYRIYKYIR